MRVTANTGNGPGFGQYAKQMNSVAIDYGACKALDTTNEYLHFKHETNIISI